MQCEIMDCYFFVETQLKKKPRKLFFECQSLCAWTSIPVWFIWSVIMWKFTMQTWIARREISNTYFHPKEMKSAHLSGIFSEQNCDRIIREKKILFLSFLINQAWKLTLNWQMVPLSVKPTDVVCNEI